MLGTRREHWVIELLNNALWPLGYASPAWVLTAIPGVSRDWWLSFRRQ
jgi:hypothetical protein